METIFDGIQRPLKDIADLSSSVFIPRGIDVPCLDQKKLWEFVPNKNLTVGSLLGPGDELGSVHENTLFPNHKIMASPKTNGRVVEIMKKGMYTVSDPVCVVEDSNGKKHELHMSHFWPVRRPRPVIEKMQANEPLLTG